MCEIVHTAMGLNEASEDSNTKDKASSIWRDGSSSGKINYTAESSSNRKVAKTCIYCKFHAIQGHLMVHSDGKCRDPQHPNDKKSSYTPRNKNGNGQRRGRGRRIYSGSNKHCTCQTTIPVTAITVVRLTLSLTPEPNQHSAVYPATRLKRPTTISRSR